jgi:hypothetical protein
MSGSDIIGVSIDPNGEYASKALHGFGLIHPAVFAMSLHVPLSELTPGAESFEFSPPLIWGIIKNENPLGSIQAKAPLLFCRVIRCLHCAYSYLLYDYRITQF